MKTNCFKLLLILSVLFTACAGSKEARTMKSSINGTWTLETIAIEGDNSILNVKVFNEADNTCFIGSNWTFMGNNGTGTYTLPQGKGECNTLTRKIHWSIYEPKDEEKRFQFKRLDDKGKPLDDNNGYRLTVRSLSDNDMKLVSQITYKNKPVSIVYNFVKK
ncbi:MAG: lipocalin family protein [Ferruginibacter sp.]